MGGRQAELRDKTSTRCRRRRQAGEHLRRLVVVVKEKQDLSRVRSAHTHADLQPPTPHKKVSQEGMNEEIGVQAALASGAIWKRSERQRW